jgi:hypothetical protein
MTELQFKLKGNRESSYPECPGTGQPGESTGEYFLRCHLCHRHLRKTKSGLLPKHYSRVEVK